MVERAGGLDLIQLRTFLAVYRAGSVTAAARLVGLSQPTVTAQLQMLEKCLGRQLFERLPRGVAPTAAAEELAARLAGPMDALEAVAGNATHAARAQPPVRLAGPAEMLAALALPALAPLIARDVRLTVTTGLAEDLLAGLRTGQYDLVVSVIRPRGRTVQAEALMDEEFVLVAAPAVAARIDTRQLLRSDPTALAAVPLLSYATDLPILRRYWRHVFHTRLDAEPAVVAADLRALTALVVAGAGISVLPRYLIAAQLDSGELTALLDPADPPINTAFLARRIGAPALPDVDAVSNALLVAGRGW
ncbi:LysR family transcriptional regulator [Nocardia macrotermitis]|uniref:HTH-type transcriptional regulator ArgP n=1 Tax=Nocardia macrotermitis TaxID=2585198 RepID=A0A7K0DDF8_9NOCA|nr:LysR family transcriptional regulator [Nocardia macrotermitis]MQY23698.1 HTH-type transcriptional regulator ArgP [Nocardia macrotermitis]